MSVSDFGKLLHHALKGPLPRPLPAVDLSAQAAAFRDYSPLELRTIVAFFPTPWRGLEGYVLWCPDHFPDELLKLTTAHGTVMPPHGISILEGVLDDGVADLRSVADLHAADALKLRITDVHVWGGKSVRASRLLERLERLSFSEGGPSVLPKLRFGPCSYRFDAPSAQEDAVCVPLETNGPSLYRCPQTCVCRVVCRLKRTRDACEGCCVADEGNTTLVPVILDGLAKELSGHHALLQFEHRTGTWKVASAPCVGPAMTVSEFFTIMSTAARA